jgi:hypothetical protein
MGRGPGVATPSGQRTTTGSPCPDGGVSRGAGGREGGSLFRRAAAASPGLVPLGLVAVSACLCLAPLPGYVSNHVPCPGARLSADFGRNSGFAFRRLSGSKSGRRYPSADLGQSDLKRPRTSSPQLRGIRAEPPEKESETCPGSRPRPRRGSVLAWDQGRSGAGRGGARRGFAPRE